MNFSEQGNAGWRSRKMRPVHAAKYDMASMILQNKKLFKFNHNMEKSDVKGPQWKIGENFVEILSHEEALEAEANEAENPTWKNKTLVTI